MFLFHPSSCTLTCWYPRDDKLCPGAALQSEGIWNSKQHNISSLPSKSLFHSLLLAMYLVTLPLFNTSNWKSISSFHLPSPALFCSRSVFTFFPSVEPLAPDVIPLTPLTQESHSSRAGCRSLSAPLSGFQMSLPAPDSSPCKWEVRLSSGLQGRMFSPGPALQGISGPCYWCGRDGSCFLGHTQLCQNPSPSSDPSSSFLILICKISGHRCPFHVWL